MRKYYRMKDEDEWKPRGDAGKEPAAAEGEGGGAAKPAPASSEEGGAEEKPEAAGRAPSASEESEEESDLDSEEARVKERWARVR